MFSGREGRKNLEVLGRVLDNKVEKLKELVLGGSIEGTYHFF